MYGFYNFTAVGKEEKMKRINGIDPGLRRSFVPTASVCAENLFFADLSILRVILCFGFDCKDW